MTGRRLLPTLPLLVVVVSLLPLVASLAFGVFMERLTMDVALSFAVLGMALSVHCLHAVRGRSNSAADASEIGRAHV